MAGQQNYINHIVLVLDASSSMGHLSPSVIKVSDNQIAYLAQRSKELDQETRITVYIFNTTNGTKCLIYDMDVLRVPSIATLYKTGGMTPLIDAVWTAIDDLAMTPEKYGEHAFLIYLLTDGMENASRHRGQDLSSKISKLPGHWTLAAFVPDQTGKFEAKKFGIPADNIEVWSTDAKGIAEVGETIRRSTDSFMQNRTKGIRSTTSLFKLNVLQPIDIINTLTPLAQNTYAIWDVALKIRIDDFVNYKVGHFELGKGFYQLTKTEHIQAQKKICILYNNRIYSGPGARKLLGLPDETVKVNPDMTPQYTIFVQSTAPNRNLIPGQRLLYFF